MIIEIGQDFRHSVSPQVVRRGDEQSTAATQFPNNKARVVDGAVSYDGVISVGRNVNAPIIEIKHEFYQRV
ncbi:hypothetical protein AJ87_41195 [Rhizobium yanglingense]|nr:hypothetical protein AJ87_41195 [Rhizobium yanglingense]